jgi:hypothetical protein
VPRIHTTSSKTCPEISQPSKSNPWMSLSLVL